MYLENRLPFYATPYGQRCFENEKEYYKELELMRSYYPQEVRHLQREVEKECDKMEYDGSMMFDEYPDRFMMEQMVKRIEKQAQDSKMEAMNKRTIEIGDLIRVLLYQEMYERRCRRRRCRKYF